MKLSTVAFALFVALIGGLPIYAQQTRAPRAASAAPDTAKLVQQVIDLTNLERTKRGLAPLKPQSNLEAAAKWMAQDMAEKGYFEHKDSKGRNIDLRLPAFGYKNYHMLGENIAAGQSTAAAVVAGWMKSPGHRANILNPGFREIGVGLYVARSGKFKYYWVQDFGTRFDQAELRGR